MSIDWTNDEQVVRAAFPEPEWETRKSLIGDYSYDGHMIITRSEDECTGDWLELGSSPLQDEAAAWAQARKHPRVRAYEQQHRGATELTEPQPVPADERVSDERPAGNPDNMPFPQVRDSDKGTELERALYWTRDALSDYKAIANNWKKRTVKAEAELLQLRQVAEARREGLAEALEREHTRRAECFDWSMTAKEEGFFRAGWLSASYARDAACEQQVLLMNANTADENLKRDGLLHKAEVRAKKAEDALAAREVEIAEAKNANERDRSEVYFAIKTLDKELYGRSWMRESRGSYEWNDDRFHNEFGEALDSFDKALEPLRNIKQDLTNCSPTLEEAGVIRELVHRAQKAEAALTQSQRETREATIRECANALMFRSGMRLEAESYARRVGRQEEASIHASHANTWEMAADVVPALLTPGPENTDGAQPSAGQAAVGK